MSSCMAWRCSWMCMRCLGTPASIKWPGDAIYIGLQVVEPLLQRVAKICVSSDEPMPLHGVASVHPVTLGPEVDVELLTHCLLMSLHWCFAPMPFVDPLVQPVPHRLASKARPSDHPTTIRYTDAYSIGSSGATEVSLSWFL